MITSVELHRADRIRVSDLLKESLDQEVSDQQTQNPCRIEASGSIPSKPRWVNFLYAELRMNVSMSFRRGYGLFGS